jgi:hypothetical protein
MQFNGSTLFVQKHLTNRHFDATRTDQKLIKSNGHCVNMSVGQMPFDQNTLNQFISQWQKFFLSFDGKHNDKTWDNKLSYKVWAMLAGLGMLSNSCWSVYAGIAC